MILPATASHRADVVGSLLRPEALKEARGQLVEGGLGPAEFKLIEDHAVDEAIRLQEEAGLPVVTDGELRRETFYGHFVDAFEGLEMAGGRRLAFRDRSGGADEVSLPVVTARLRWRHSLCAEEWAYLRARTSRSGKVTLPGPILVGGYWDPERSRDAYPTREGYLADVVALLRKEVEELIRLGCTYIQVDSPAYSSHLDPERREQMRRQGIDPDRRVDESIELENAMVGGHPGITFAVHICRGNYRGRFSSQGDYDPVVRVFQRSRFDRFLLEYDSDRAGGFEPLRAVPDDRTVVLGLITTKEPTLEDVAELKGRIIDAARYFPLTQMALSTQCGFASSIEGNPLTTEDQRRKLELVVRVASEVWG